MNLSNIFSIIKGFFLSLYLHSTSNIINHMGVYISDEIEPDEYTNFIKKQYIDQLFSDCNSKYIGHMKNYLVFIDMNNIVSSGVQLEATFIVFNENNPHIYAFKVQVRPNHYSWRPSMVRCIDVVDVSDTQFKFVENEDEEFMIANYSLLLRSPKCQYNKNKCNKGISCVDCDESIDYSVVNNFHNIRDTCNIEYTKTKDVNIHMSHSWFFIERIFAVFLLHIKNSKKI